MPPAPLTLTVSYPLDWPKDWPRTESYRRASGAIFQCTTGTATHDLRHDLGVLGATYAAISSWIPVSASGNTWRGDMGRVGLDDPGVSLAFVRQDREYILARDAFRTPLANLRSIGLAVRGLVGLERHGGTAILDRAFAGFAALPPPATAPAERTWREILDLVDLRGPRDAQLAAAEARFRSLARHAHPDNGGAPGAMVTLNRAIAEARQELR